MVGCRCDRTSTSMQCIALRPSLCSWSRPYNRLSACVFHTFPQVDLQVKWSLYQARMSFHRHELGMSWPSEILGMVVEE